MPDNYLIYKGQWYPFDNMCVNQDKTSPRESSQHWLGFKEDYLIRNCKNNYFHKLVLGIRQCIQNMFPLLCRNGSWDNSKNMTLNSFLQMFPDRDTLIATEEKYNMHYCKEQNIWNYLIREIHFDYLLLKS